MDKPVLLATVLAFLCGCTTIDPSPPESNPSPRAKFAIFGQKDPTLEVHFRIVFITQHNDCLEHRPFLGGGVVRMHTDELSFAAGKEEFTAEFFLDRYSPGHCEWRARNIEVRVSRPAHGAFFDSWQSFAWVDYGYGIGTPGLEEVRYVCRRPTPTSTAVSCSGPTARVSTTPGQIRASFVVGR